MTTAQESINCTLKVYLVADEEHNIPEEFLGLFPRIFHVPIQYDYSGEGTFEVTDTVTELTHRSPFTEKSSIRARVNLQHYQ